MGKLPEKFPEYSIMHKTISQKISELESKEQTTDITSQIKNYKKELERIEKMFPEDYFNQ